MSVRLRIDRIVLDGYALGQRDQCLFRDALETELGRLLGGADDRAGWTSRAVASAVGPPLVPPTGGRPMDLGVAAARSIREGIG